jgi:hypothetical protein
MDESTSANQHDGGTGSSMGDAAAEAQQKAWNVAEQQKAAGANKVEGVADAVHSAARKLDQQLPQASGLLDQAAERLDRTASALRERNMGDFAESIGKFARSQPMIFFAGAVFAGFALSRFLKSSGDPLHKA